MSKIKMDSDIAVIGMSCKFPMADNLNEFWQNIKNGKDCIREAPPTRINDWLPFFEEKIKYLPPLGYLEDISHFDPNFFNMVPGEAPLIDPSQKLLLEVIAETFQYGGYNEDHLNKNPVGVFISIGNSGYRELINLRDFSTAVEISNNPAVAAGRISHSFRLSGPSLLIDTACSSSLVAIHYACESLKRNECSMAVVGAANIHVNLDEKIGGIDIAAIEDEVKKTLNNKNFNRNKADILKHYAHRCRFFDRAADGILNGEGVGAVLLKPLKQAILDKDIICATIKGSAVNHNAGRTNTISGQKPEPQAEVMIKTLQDTNINPESISFIEASGTATEMGDPIEIEGISTAFAKFTNRKEFCPMGCIKANIGHLNHTSGIAGLIKSILALQHRQIPPQIKYEETNPHIDFKNSPVYINKELRDWDLKQWQGNSRRVGINSFSLNGTNCHMIIEEAPIVTQSLSVSISPIDSKNHYLFTLSAKSVKTLKEFSQKIIKEIESFQEGKAPVHHSHINAISNNSKSLADICYTLNVHRDLYDHRMAIICRDKQELLKLLRSKFNENHPSTENSPDSTVFYGSIKKRSHQLKPKAVFLFSGDEKNLSEVCKDFLKKNFFAKKYIEECNQLFQFEQYPRLQAFACQYALAKLWLDMGIKPSFVLGYGIGKYVSKVISNQLSLEEALKICSDEKFNDISYNKEKFQQNINLLISKGQRLFLEIGTESELGQLTQKCLQDKSDFFLLNSYDKEKKEKGLLKSLAWLFTQGMSLNFSSLFPGRKVVLPPYPFNKKRYWANPPIPEEKKGDFLLDKGVNKNKILENLETSKTIKKPIQQKLIEIFQVFFGKEELGPEDDFFQLGGDSLKAITLSSELYKNFQVKVPIPVMFEMKVIKDLAKYIREASKEEYHAIHPIEKKEYYPLSSAQKRLYILHQMDSKSTVYNMSELVHINNTSNISQLNHIIEKIIHRHESLRTSFHIFDNNPIQRINEKVEFKIQKLNMENENIEDNDIYKRIPELLHHFTQPFDLSKAPLIRVQLIHIKNSPSLLLIDSHHIITDGTSHALIQKEFNQLFSGELLPHLRIHYKDYTHWQNKPEQQKRLNKQKEYWINILLDNLPVLSLPLDYPRPRIQQFEGKNVSFLLNESKTQLLRNLSKKFDTTLYMNLMAAFSILLSKLSGQEDIIIGTPVASRRHYDLKSIIGMFVNTLVLRNNPIGEKNIENFLKEVKSQTLLAYENQDYQFEDLVEKISMGRDTSRNPIFDVVLNLINHDEYNVDISKNLKIPNKETIKKSKLENRYVHQPGTAKFDINFSVVEFENFLQCNIEYCSHLFKPSTIERFIEYFFKILHSMTINPQLKVAELEILSDQEKAKILEICSNDYHENAESMIHLIFQEKANQKPWQRALQLNDLTITYKDLDGDSNSLANQLKTKGLPADSIVGIMLDRSVGMIVSILAILKIGGAYLPIDIEYPKDRKEYMITDSGINILITDRTVIEQKYSKKEIDLSSGVELIDIESFKNDSQEIDNQSHNITFLPNSVSSQLAYIIYTSGTTGKPKGMAIEHRNVTQLLFNDHFKFDFDFTDIWTLFHSYCFDFSVWEMYGALLYGGALIIIPKLVAMNSIEFLQLLQRKVVTVLNQTPSAFYQLINLAHSTPQLSLNLKYIIFGGEALSAIKLKEWQIQFPNTKLINMYGITETTVHVTFKQLDHKEISKNTKSIGQPLPNISLYPLDKYLNLNATGVPGELCVGGGGVGRGYINRPELTNKKFIHHPHKKNEVIYRSGDLGKMFHKEFEYLGRIDQQVKIRGHRIELGEIEDQLLKHPDIKEAIIVLKEKEISNHFICAYIISDKVLNPSELRDYLSLFLPSYMIPAYFVSLDKIPLTPNGKINHNALPEPEIKINKNMIEPQTQLEKELSRIWSEILEIKTPIIDINSNFFELGGHSLKATILIALIQKELKVKIPLAKIFLHPTIRTLAQYINNSTREKYISINPAEQREYYLLSSAQKRLYILQQMDLNNTAYNMPEVIYFEKSPNFTHLENVINRIINQHESLRTSFHMVESRPVQRIHDKVEFEVEVLNIKAEEFERSESNERFPGLLQDFTQPFDLSKAPLLRVQLIQSDQSQYRLHLDMHHIITDGISINILTNEFMNQQEVHSTTKMRLQYKDFALWQNSKIQRDLLEEQKKYWLKVFSDEAPILDLPLDYPRPLMQSFEGNSIQFIIKNPGYQSIKYLEKKTNTTFFMTIFSIFSIFISKLSGQEDIVIGTPVAGRRHIDVEGIIGMFVNTLPLRIHPSGDLTLLEFISHVKTQTLNAFENQEYPFEELVEQLAVPRNTGRNPIFDVMFNFITQDVRINKNQNESVQSQDINTFVNQPIENQFKIAKFDITLIAKESNEEIIFSFEYCTKLFKPRTIKKFIDFFKKIISSIEQNPVLKISDIEIISEQEKKRILTEFNNTDSLFPNEKMIIEQFDLQAAISFHHISLISVDVQISCNKLVQMVEKRALALFDKGIGSNCIVGLFIERSIEMIISIFGIMKAGGTYLPIDTNYPRERINFLLNDSNAKLLITTSILNKTVNTNLDVFLIDTFSYKEDSINPPKISFSYKPSDMAYLIYTSGTTGKPKGVIIEHQSLVNRLNWMQKTFSIDKSDILLQKTTFTFDVSVWEIFWWCLTNAKLCLLEPEGEKDPSIVLDTIEKNQVSIIHFVPSMLRVFLEYIQDSNGYKKMLSIKQVMASGEELSSLMVKNFYMYFSQKKMMGIKLNNLYGPTEATIDVSFHICSRTESLEKIPIGKPIDNTHLYIIDRNRILLPIGITGELCISGIGLAKGYLNRPELTMERFVDNDILSRYGDSQKNGFKKIYLTGDLARWFPDGSIEYLGRRDHQVKIRGFRIELDEIKEQLVKFDNIKDAVIIPREFTKTNIQLVAYFVPYFQEAQGENFVDTEIKAQLSKKLPNYMIPQYFISINKIPISHNGKLDRKSLPLPKIKSKVEYQSPRNFIEEKLVEIWQQVLGINPIGINDDFFELGGDSIKGVQISARLNKYNLKLEMKDLFLNSRISQLGKFVKKITRIADQSDVSGEIPLIPVQQWFFENFPEHYHHFNQSVMIFRKDGFSATSLKQVFSKIVRHHDALRMVFEFKTTKTGFAPGKNKRLIQQLIKQKNRGITKNKDNQFFDLKVINLLDFKNNFIEKIQEEGRIIQSSIKLETGPLLKLGLFKTPQGDHLLIVIHHLVIDGISWRILLEDFSEAYKQAINHSIIKLPLKTDSFMQWSNQLVKYAKAPTMQIESSYWEKIQFSGVPELPKDFNISRNEQSIKNSQVIQLKLNHNQTNQLLRKIHHAYNTEIIDILLSALGLSLYEWSKNNQILIHLEGHGRENIIKDIDISRTIGWFTSLYPILLKLDNRMDLSKLIKTVKENLRKIPHKGIGYGILKYLIPPIPNKPITFYDDIEIIFNYLGEFSNEENNQIFKMSEIQSDSNISPDLKRMATLEINGLISDGIFVLSFSYNKREYHNSNIKNLVNQCKANLLNIIDHCMRKENREITPSDLTYPNLSLFELDKMYQYLEDNIDPQIVNRKIEIADAYELSPMQAGMLFHALKDNDSNTYFEQTVFSLRGAINKNLLEKSFDFLIKRYEILRTIFYFEATDQPLQVVLKHQIFKIKYKEIEIHEKDNQDKQIQEFCNHDREKGFNLSRDQLIRISLLKIGENHYKLIWSFHHILMDGWCLSILYNEIMHIYNSLERGEFPELEPIVQYREYIKWLRNNQASHEYSFWKDYLNGYEQGATIPQFLNIPQFIPAREGDSQVSYILGEYTLQLDEIISENLREIAKTNHVTLNTMVQAIWGIVLKIYNNTDDVVFGSVVSGRPSEIEGIEHMVGLFINTIPVRVISNNTETFIQLIKRLQDKSLEAKPYEYLSLAQIQSDSYLKEKLFDHILIFENYPLDNEVKNSSKQHGESKFNVDTIDAFEQTNYNFNIIISPATNITFKFSYNSLIFTQRTIRKIGSHFDHIIKQLIIDTEINVNELEITASIEKKQLLYEFNQTMVKYNQDKTIKDAFEEQVGKTPHHIAGIAPLSIQNGISINKTNTTPKSASLFQTAMTYRELNTRSNQLAHWLLDSGITPETIIALKAERNIELLIGLLAILKSGAAYLPIGPEYPPERINYMLRHTNTPLILSTRDDVLKELDIPSISQLNIADTPKYKYKNGTNPGHKILPHQLAYIIYTSGTTGIPKGVMIENQSVINFIKGMTNIIPFGCNDRILSLTTLSFDIFGLETLLTLTTGAGVVIGDESQQLDAGLGADIIKRELITIFQLTPSRLQLFFSHPNASTSFQILKYLIVGGETLPPPLLKKTRKLVTGKIFNVYGPTETTIWSSIKEVSGEKSLNIGQPLANTHIYIVDERNHLQPVGISGELCISGHGLARGYLKDHELTARKFVMNPFSYSIETRAEKKHYARMYCTGDLSRWLYTGNIEFLGRKDHQVKIRGFRIETGEIETRLLEHPLIQEALVIDKMRDDGEKFLCAYFVSDNNDEDVFETNGLRKHLARFIPEYMVPSFFLKIDQFPLNANGKIDRKLLPEPGIESQMNKYYAPRNPIEEKLVKIWNEILKIDSSAESQKIGIYDNFFHLGGHSLKATILSGKISKEFDVNVPLAEIFKNPTIGELSSFIQKSQKTAFIELYKTEEKDYYPLSSNQKRLWLIQQIDPQNSSYNMPQFISYNTHLDLEKLEIIIGEIIIRHESLRTGFKSINGEPFQFILKPPVKFPLNSFDISSYSENEKKERLNNILEKEVKTPFDLSNPPLFRSLIVKLDFNQYHILFNIHHIVTDGWSQEILKKEFLRLNQMEQKNNSSQMRPVHFQYKDFSAWEQKQLQHLSFKEKSHHFWKQTLSGELPKIEFPKDFPGKNDDFKAVIYTGVINMTRKEQLLKLAENCQTSLFTVLLSIFKLLISQITSLNNIVVGIPVSGRHHLSLHPIVGFFVNTIVLKSQITEKQSLTEFINDVSQNVLEALQYQFYPLESVLDDLKIKFPEIGIFFNMLNFDQDQQKIEGLKLESTHYDDGTDVKFPIELYVSEYKDSIEITWKYRKTLYKPITIESLMKRYTKLIDFFSNNSEKNLMDYKKSIKKRQLKRRK